MCDFFLFVSCTESCRHENIDEMIASFGSYTRDMLTHANTHTGESKYMTYEYHTQMKDANAIQV